MCSQNSISPPSCIMLRAAPQSRRRTALGKRFASTSAILTGTKTLGDITNVANEIVGNIRKGNLHTAQTQASLISSAATVAQQEIERGAVASSVLSMGSHVRYAQSRRETHKKKCRALLDGPSSKRTRRSESHRGLHDIVASNKRKKVEESFPPRAPSGRTRQCTAQQESSCDYPLPKNLCRN